MTAKLCIDCKHMRRSRGAWCMAPVPGQVDLVYGGPIPVRQLCSNARVGVLGACGPNGNLFEVKPPKRSFWSWLIPEFL